MIPGSPIRVRTVLIVLLSADIFVCHSHLISNTKARDDHILVFSIILAIMKWCEPVDAETQFVCYRFLWKRTFFLHVSNPVAQDRAATITRVLQ